MKTIIIGTLLLLIPSITHLIHYHKYTLNGKGIEKEYPRLYGFLANIFILFGIGGALLLIYSFGKFVIFSWPGAVGGSISITGYALIVLGFIFIYGSIRSVHVGYYTYNSTMSSIGLLCVIVGVILSGLGKDIASG